METEATITFKVMNQEFVKLDRFDGSNFNRWKDTMLFLLTVLNVAYVLDPNLQLVEDPAPMQTPRKLQKWSNSRRSARKTISHVMDTSSTHCLIDYMISTCRCNHRWKYRKLLKRNTTPSDRSKLSSRSYPRLGTIIERNFCIWQRTSLWRKYLGICVKGETRKRDAVYLP
ncbi:hypothetical protein CXB51_016772 [Gossypium anomalum]|uniref:Uncharacterized protein n=1 Tax=Gossypium anomalum TaxID=47600 RepID=A0A8J5YTN0_9ROSI|nr:hypothetical protein CXB51_016772 [Gossypium anomalum]